MWGLVLATSRTSALDLGVLITAVGFGFRHGIDWDHIAALTDITGSQTTPRQSMLTATLYALGHALVVFALGTAAVTLGHQLPNGVDTVMERFVGVTLVVLALYVVVSLARQRRDFRMRSRWMLLYLTAKKATRWIRARRTVPDFVEIIHDHPHPADAHHHLAQVRAPVTVAATGGGRTTELAHRHAHSHVLPIPDDPFATYSAPTALSIGMIHGIGAETPTQLLIFLTAAGTGGKAAGMFVLLMFLAGLLASNTMIALASTFGYLKAGRNPHIYITISVLTAAFSLAIGALFLVGKATLLPGLLGG